jgi:tetratricopeptide (TPR) repeat protein
MKKIIFILLLFPSLCNAQVNLDSLFGVWNDQTQADTNRLKAMKVISWKGYLFNQPDSAFYFAQLQFDFAKEKGQKKYMAYALNTQGVSFYLQGNYTKAIHYYTQSLKIHEELGNKKGIPSALNNIGIIYKVQGDYAKAIDYYTQSLKIYEEIGNKRGIGNVLGNIGGIYNYQGESAKAMDYYTQSLKIKEELGNKKGIASTLNNIGNNYNKQGEFAKAMDYYTQSLKIREELGDKQGIAKSLGCIGIIYEEQGEYAKAMDYYTQSLKTYEEFGDKDGIAWALANIGNIYKEQGNFKAAIGECLKSFKISNEIGAAFNQKEACSCLYDSYKSLGNFNKALDYHEQMMVLKDTLFKKENTKKIARQEMQYEYDKKQALQEVEEEKLRLEQINLDNIKQAASDRKDAIQVAGICVFIALFISLLLWLSKRKVNPKVLKYLGTFSILVVFEFIAVILHPAIIELTHHDLVLTLLCTVGIAVIIVPFHHKIEHFLVQRLVVKENMLKE